MFINDTKISFSDEFEIDQGAESVRGWHLSVYSASLHVPSYSLSFAGTARWLFKEQHRAGCVLTYHLT